ncbi:MAG: lipopolysaccharide biosynthesis protein [Clostridia bacterium]|nr:lipopolysaccharide biosynthesis protein [Clostridia bacterium]MBP3554188.1 lipopolysaccharide biosynthesis protein [Clostridia bacterium]
MVNILFCGNDKVFDGMLTCALSILKRSASEEPFTFYVFTMDVSHIKETYLPVTDAQLAFFERVIKTYHSENRAIKIDVTSLYMEEFGGCPNEDAYCSPYTLIRLFADKVTELPDKILYLDIDIMFNRDIHLLYDIDISGVEYAAARDHYGKYLISPNYVNAGVLLFNLAEMRKTGLLEKARTLIKTKKLVFADQSAIIRATTKKKMLPQRFNDQKFLHQHTVVRHFSKRLFWLPYPHTDNIKQWHVSRVHKIFRYYQFDDILYEYIYLKEKYNREVMANG